MKVMKKTLRRNRKRIRTTSRSRRRRRNIPVVTKKVWTKKSQVSRENSSAGGPVLSLVANPYKLTFKEILQPAGNKVETTTVLLNDLCGALMQGHPIDHIPSSKKYLEVGYMLMKKFINHKEVLLVKTQHQLHHMQGVLAFVQGTEDENNISLNKSDFVTHITKNVIDKVALKDLIIRIPFPVNRLADGVNNINDCFVPGVHYTFTPVSVYGRHIKILIVSNLDVQPHEARK
jgi:hypothetical protein